MIVIALGAAAGALLVVLFVAGPRLRSRALDTARATLFAEARLMARLVRPALVAGASSSELDRLVDTAAGDVRARVTIIAPDGTVLADAELSGRELAAVENHATRPEILQARAKGSGSSLRRSATVNRDLLYGAVTIEEDGRLLGFSRVAYTLSELEEQARQLHRAVAFALLVAFGITAALATFLIPPVMGSMKTIMDAAQRLAAGDLSARSEVGRSDELGELARILNASADLLQERLDENARDQARTQAILSAMEDGVLAVDHRGTVLVANDPPERPRRRRTPLGRHYTEVVRQGEVGTVIEDVLRTGERRAVEVEFGPVATTYRPHRRALPRGGQERPTARCSPSTTSPTASGSIGSAATSWPTPRTSCARRSPRSAASSRRSRTGRSRTAGTARALPRQDPHARRPHGRALVAGPARASRLESGDRPPLWEPVQRRRDGGRRGGLVRRAWPCASRIRGCGTATAGVPRS